MVACGGVWRMIDSSLSPGCCNHCAMKYFIAISIDY
jgi:hypothetical protein